jgi:hypothetical protein
MFSRSACIACVHPLARANFVAFDHLPFFNPLLALPQASDENDFRETISCPFGYKTGSSSTALLRR